MSAKRRLRALENVRNVQRSNGTVQEKTKDCESEVENMAKFGINDILNAKTKAAGQQAQTEGYKEIYLSPYEVKAAQENTHQKLENIEELADSFLHVGQEQPTVLARVNGEYRIIDGHRRNAANILNLERGHKEYEKVLYRFMDMSEAMYELRLLAGNGFTQELKGIFKDLDENKRKLVTPLIEKAAFNMGVSVKESFFMDEIAVAEGSLSKKAEFLTKYCNIKQNSSIAWLEYQTVENAGVEKTLEDFRDCYAVGGIDLSQTTDLTAASVVIQKDGTLYAFTQFFMPRGRLEYLQASNLLRVVQEQQETIEKQSRLIADLIATLESWEQTAGYDGAELKERAENLQLRERQDL